MLTSFACSYLQNSLAHSIHMSLENHLLLATVQVAGASELAKRMKKEDSENLLAHLVYSGTLIIDFGHTAYATNVYLRCAQRAGSALAGRPHLCLWLSRPVSHACCCFCSDCDQCWGPSSRATLLAVLCGHACCIRVLHLMHVGVIP